MDISNMVNAMTPEIFEKLQSAVETGKWQNGDVLTAEQKDNALQAVLLYQAKVDRSNEHMTVGEDGEVVHKSKSQLRQELKQQFNNETPIARFDNDDI